MPRSKDLGSLTKEIPLEKFDAAMGLLEPELAYKDFVTRVESNGLDSAIPGLLRKRFLRFDEQDRIVYDGMLSLLGAEGIASPRIGKILYFIWAIRDRRIGAFIQHVVANKHGKWRAKELSRKSHAAFFEQFNYSAKSAVKVRSNLEYFLIETGVFDDDSGTVDLDTSDGWLHDAMAVLADNEPDLEVRSRMTADPLGFLVSKGMNGLVDFEAGEKAPSAVGTLQLPDLEEETGPDEEKQLSGSKGADEEWQPSSTPSSSSGQEAPEQFFRNSAALERANVAHRKLEALLASRISASGHSPLRNESIDVYYRTPDGGVILEVKSCHAGNIHTQVRRGIAQLFEYRFVHQSRFEGSVRLGLALETKPRLKKAWLSEFLAANQIVPFWPSSSWDKLVTPFEIPSPLAGVLEAE